MLTPRCAVSRPVTLRRLMIRNKGSREERKAREGQMPNAALARCEHAARQAQTEVVTGEFFFAATFARREGGARRRAPRTRRSV